MKTTEQLRQERDEWRAEAATIMERSGGNDLAGDDATRFDTLVTDIKARDEQLQRLDSARDLDLAAIRSAATGGGDSRFGIVDADRNGDPAASIRQRDDALRTLDRHDKAGTMSKESCQLVERLMSTGSGPAQSWTKRWAAATGSEDYTAAFAKLVADPQRGHLRWSPQEAEAFRAVEAIRDEQRAMSLTDNAGGYMVPMHLDPHVILTNAGNINPLRQISRNVTITSDAWKGVTSAGATSSFDAEADEVSDDSPTLAQPSVPVYKLQTFIPFSVEVQGDAAGFMDELTMIMADSHEQKLAEVFTTGSGSGQPTGVITALAGGSSIVTPTAGESFTAPDPYKVQNALSPRWQANAQWCANLAIINAAAQFETTNGALKFPGLQDNPPRLLNRAVNELSNMDGTYDAAATANNYALLYGDFSQFLVVTRVGSTLELVPHLFGSSRRPTGQRGMWLWARYGSDVLVDDAFRLLNIATTA